MVILKILGTYGCHLLKSVFLCKSRMEIIHFQIISLPLDAKMFSQDESQNTFFTKGLGFDGQVTIFFGIS